MEKTLWYVEKDGKFVLSTIRPEGSRLPTQEELYYYKLYQVQKSLDNRHIGGVLRMIGRQEEPIEITFDEVYKKRNRSN